MLLKAGLFFCLLTGLCFQSALAELDLSKTALIIVDVQNDFCAGGTVATPHGDDVIPAINHLRSGMKFGKVLLTKDWHPPNHVSFFEHFSNKSVHPNAKLGEEYTFDLGDGRGMRSQILWPTHCVQNSTGAEIRVGLETKETDIIVYKGTHPDVDSYSGFVDNDGETETEMDAILKEHGIEELFVTGLAYEYCVGNTARDGLKKGYKVTIVDDATGSFSPDKKHEQADKFRKAGISIRTVTEILNSLSRTTTGLSCPSCACPTCTCSVILNSETKDIKPENSCHCSNCICPKCSSVFL